MDDSGWQPAALLCSYGQGPWDSLIGVLTLSPAKSSPYEGTFILSEANLEKGKRIILRTSPITPEDAARVTLNNQFAGGFIGQPARLDITSFVQAGANQIRIEPWAPDNVWLEIE
jgi:hypothetical protein